MNGTAIIGTIKKRKIHYYGHVKRHKNIFKELLEGKAEGKRERDRQQTTWESNVATWAGRTCAGAQYRQTIRENGGVVSMLQPTSIEMALLIDD